MSVEHYPYRGRAWWGQLLLAESDQCLLVDREGELSVLCFPRSAIDVTHLKEGQEPRPCPEGEASFWSIDDPREADSSDSWHTPETSGEDGRDILRTFTHLSADLEQLAGYGAFDQERIRVEAVDGDEGDERGTTIKRVPDLGGREASH